MTLRLKARKLTTCLETDSGIIRAANNVDLRLSASETLAADGTHT